MTEFLIGVLTDLGPLSVLVLMLVIFAETGLLIGFFLPGDSLLFTAGLLVASGVLPVSLWVVILATWVAGALGDQVAYIIGGRLGQRLFAEGRSRWISRTHLEAAHVFFERHGHKAVVMARFVPLVRTFTPVVAGAAEMPRRRFTVYNIAGGLLWTGGMATAGYFLGGVPIVANHVDLVAVAIIFVSLIPAAVTVLRHRAGRAAEAGSEARAVVEEPEREVAARS